MVVGFSIARSGVPGTVLATEVVEGLSFHSSYLWFRERACFVASSCNGARVQGLGFSEHRVWCLINSNTLISSVQLLTSKPACHVELFGLRGPERLGAL